MAVCSADSSAGINLLTFWPFELLSHAISFCVISFSYFITQLSCLISATSKMRNPSGWMDVQEMDGWMGRWMDGWMDGRTDRYVRKDKWMDGWIDEWMDWRMDGLKEGRRNRWKNGRKSVHDPVPAWVNESPGKTTHTHTHTHTIVHYFT